MTKQSLVDSFRMVLSYFLAVAYQFCGTFPKTKNVIVPENYSQMNWLHFTHFLCLLSNKLYPLNVPDGKLSSTMIYAIKEKIAPDMSYNQFVDLMKVKGVKNA